MELASDGRAGLDHDFVGGNAITGGHGEVGDGGKGGDESCQDVEHAFLLAGISMPLLTMGRETYSWDTESHCVEGEGSDDHDHKDDPGGESASWTRLRDADDNTIVYECQLRYWFGIRCRG